MKEVNGIKEYFQKMWHKVGLSRKIRLIITLATTGFVMIAFLFTYQDEFNLIDYIINLAISFVALYLLTIVYFWILNSVEYFIERSKIFAAVGFVIVLVGGSILITIGISSVTVEILNLYKVENPMTYLGNVITVFGIIVAAIVPIILTNNTMKQNRKDTASDRKLLVKPLLRYTFKGSMFGETSKMLFYCTESSRKCNLEIETPQYFIIENKSENIVRSFVMTIQDVKLKIDDSLVDCKCKFELDKDKEIVSLYKNEFIYIRLHSPVRTYIEKFIELLPSNSLKMEITFIVEVEDIISSKYTQLIQVILDYGINHNSPEIYLNIISNL
jgi:hypothetical protein